MTISSKFWKSLFISSLFILISCTDVSETEVPKALNLDQAAETYVKLALELGQYDKDYVDAYLGPKDWAEEAKNNLRTKQQLATDIAELYDQLKALHPAKKQTKLRHKALSRNVRAMDVRIRMVNGEKFSFVEEALLIYDATLPKYDFSIFDQALVDIDKLIPGDGDLSTRVDNFRDSFVIPDNRVEAVVSKAIEECRKRTAKYISMPSTEGFILEYVKDKSWSGYNWYQGNNKSLMQINQDFPMHIGRAIDLGCHEGYPGHHVWNVLSENAQLNENQWIEFSIFPLFSPYALIGEGSANYGVDLAFPNAEKMTYEMEVLYPMAGLDPMTAYDLSKLDKLTEKLSHAMTATAQLYLDGEISREQAVEQRRKYSLTSKERAEQSVRFIEQYRAYVLNYNLGKDIVADYISKKSDSHEQRWKAFESLLTELSTASDMHN